MMSSFVESRLKSIPQEVKIFVNLYTNLQIRVADILEQKQMTQKDLADKLGKQPSEISKWLNGEHNFTLRSLAKLQAELGEVLIEVPGCKPKVPFNDVKSIIQTIPVFAHHFTQSAELGYIPVNKFTKKIISTSIKKEWKPALAS